MVPFNWEESRKHGPLEALVIVVLDIDAALASLDGA